MKARWIHTDYMMRVVDFSVRIEERFALDKSTGSVCMCGCVYVCVSVLEHVHIYVGVCIDVVGVCASIKAYGPTRNT